MDHLKELAQAVSDSSFNEIVWFLTGSSVSRLCRRRLSGRSKLDRVIGEERRTAALV